MSDVDQVAAAKASLELMLLENRQLLEQFESLLENLQELESLPPEERHSRFHELENAGAFQFRGIDIRHFGHPTKRPLSPQQFLRRTHRRLANTNTLIGEFLKRGPFEVGLKLRSEIDQVTSDIVDEEDAKEVLAFKQRVDEIRESEMFQEYLEAKKAFLQQDPALKTESDILAVTEHAQEAHEALEGREKALQELNDNLESGEVTAEEVAQQLDDLDLGLDGD